MITTERNWRERKNWLDELFCAFFFFCFFVFCFKSYWTKLLSKVLKLTTLVSFLFIANITGQTAFIKRSKLFLRFVFWNCRKFFFKKNLKSVSLYSYRLFTENMKVIKSGPVWDLHFLLFKEIVSWEPNRIRCFVLLQDNLKF